MHGHDEKPPAGMLQLGTVSHTSRHDDDSTRACTPTPAFPKHLTYTVLDLLGSCSEGRDPTAVGTGKGKGKGKKKDTGAGVPTIVSFADRTPGRRTRKHARTWQLRALIKGLSFEDHAGSSAAGVEPMCSYRLRPRRSGSSYQQHVPGRCAPTRCPIVFARVR